MDHYKIYIGFLSTDAQDAAIKTFSRLGWFPEASEDGPDVWILAVPAEDDSLLWFLEESAVMEIWEW